MTVFRDERFGEVRTATINGEPWFVGKDVAEMLGYQNGSRDINRHVDEEDRNMITVNDGRQNRDVIIINESGLYSLILSSKLPQAKEFKRWVTSVILPALRRTGSYIAGEEHMDEDELIAQGYLALQRKLAARTAELGRANEVIAELAPKAAYYDAVAGSEGDKSFRETAKTFGVPEKKFIAFLIDHGYVYRDARGTLTPYADHMKRGQFTVREIVYNGAETIRTSSQTRITPKGRQVIWRAMEKDGLITL
jgi:prophage antirepressor-like protein